MGRMTLITGGERRRRWRNEDRTRILGERRRWSEDFKDRAITASLEPGTNVSATALARSLDITPSQLFGWRRAAALRAEKMERQAPAEPRAAKTRRVEIELGGAVVRVNADISEADFQRQLMPREQHAGGHRKVAAAGLTSPAPMRAAPAIVADRAAAVRAYGLAIGRRPAQPHENIRRAWVGHAHDLPILRDRAAGDRRKC